ncbi:hypothetical protein [Nocardioides gilvus]|uniref:hypothetical protein n=1 Tax=Nocardioides gilvus TaxID=1735589 RepID=UPI000D747608|nr:hypothetical protein [Nocardioides gilvus]
MSTEHKRPLYAFAILALACALFVGNGLRSDAIGGVLRADDRVAAILSVLPAAEKKVTSVPTPSEADTPSVRMVVASSASASTPEVAPAQRVIATAEVARAKAAEHKKTSRDAVTKPQPRPNGHAGRHGHGAKHDRAKHDRAKHDHRGQGAAQVHSTGRSKGHARGQGGSHGKRSRDAHGPRAQGHRSDRGQQHRPRQSSQQGRSGEKKQHGRSGQGHDSRQDRGAHGQGSKQTGKNQGHRGGRGSSASHSRHRV